MRLEQFKKAFSLVELSIVLVVISLIVGVIVGNNRLTATSKISAAQTLTKSSPVSEIEGLILWLETTMPVSITEVEADHNKTVSTWYDLSPEKNNATAGGAPTYINNAINGLPVLRFNGSSNYLSYSGSLIVNTSYTIFVVEQRRSSASMYFLGGANQVANQMLDVGFLDVGATDRAYWDQWIAAPQYTIPDYNSPIPRIHSLVHVASTSKTYYINGSSVGSTTNSSYTSNLTAYAGAVIGSMGGSGYFNGDIAEIIMFSKSLSDKERRDVEQYLGKKWGVTIS